jgi:glyoxylate carboligase
MDNLKEKTNNQLNGRIGYIAKSCKNCDFDYCGGCNFAREIQDIEEELKSRKVNNVKVANDLKEYIRMSKFYEDMPQDFRDAVEVIKQYCQFEDCDCNCEECPHSLKIIRCGDDD